MLTSGNKDYASFDKGDGPFETWMAKWLPTVLTKLECWIKYRSGDKEPFIPWESFLTNAKRRADTARKKAAETPAAHKETPEERKARKAAEAAKEFEAFKAAEEREAAKEREAAEKLEAGKAAKEREKKY